MDLPGESNRNRMSLNTSMAPLTGMTYAEGATPILGNDNPAKLLVVDDEPDTVFILQHILRFAGFDVVPAFSGPEALRKTADYSPNLVLLDLMMPEMDGWVTLDHLRKVSDVPVIILSALGEKKDIIAGLTQGADDYIAKPFDKNELVARVKTVLRRANANQGQNLLRFPDIQLEIDLENHTVLYEGTRFRPSPREFEFLAEIARHAPHIVAYPLLCNQIWQEDSHETRNRLKFLAFQLRKKFYEVNPDQELVSSVNRKGYRLITQSQDSA
jgi:DNA-binding response OmpR family regulator